MGYEVGPSGWQPDSEVKAQGRHSGLHRGSVKSGLGMLSGAFLVAAGGAVDGTHILVMVPKVEH